ncbi:response regulator [Rhizobiales bacterium RZME27]|uniref:Response regulator n=2 Tax=Endobacterium cereale TaxID=2663029 RepID=A0A6A8A612_9HYPH|nr:response regulator [Endobacterium cereale]MQY46543.1 response regulator [Endobacterium cereale]
MASLPLSLRCPQKSLPVEIPPHSSQALNVLLAEDDGLIRANTAETLRDLGHSVTEAASGQEAITLAQDSFDLLVTDIGLPDISGQQLVEELRTAGRVFEVILASGHARGTVDIPDGAQLITKPYSPEDLSRVISELFVHRSR